MIEQKLLEKIDGDVGGWFLWGKIGKRARNNQRNALRRKKKSICKCYSEDSNIFRLVSQGRSRYGNAGRMAAAIEVCKHRTSYPPLFQLLRSSIFPQ
jgi:hypothetical protein